MILRILEIIGAIGILVGLWNVQKNRKWWLVYAVAGNIPFLIVNTYKGLYAFAIMALILAGTGIKNYIREGKDKSKGVDPKYLWQIIEDLSDGDPCQYDHHGYCQAHDWFDDIRDCPQKRIQIIKSTSLCKELEDG